jgi:predicted transcriptional regulator of viral defense system
MKQYFTIDKWVEILRKASSKEEGLLSLTALSRLSGLKDFTLRKALIRIEEKRLVERVGPGLYLNRFGRTTLEDMAMVLGKPCYISFESALCHHGIVSQEPLVLTCATTRKPQRKSTPLGEIVFRHIATNRFWGYVVNGRILMAEPEKGFLDWLYWSNKTRGRFPDLDEVNWEEMNKEKILLYSKKFPKSIQKFLKNMHLFTKISI